jgi:hypothetical protein
VGIRFRKLPDGTLFVPQRGTPPEAPEGYEAVAGNPYTFVKKMPACKYRGEEKLAKSCCGGRTAYMTCSLDPAKKPQRILRVVCNRCDKYES